MAETYAKIGDCLERMARVEPDKLLARTEVRASDGMHKLKKVSCRLSTCYSMLLYNGCLLKDTWCSSVLDVNRDRVCFWACVGMAPYSRAVVLS